MQNACNDLYTKHQVEIFTIDFPCEMIENEDK